MALHLKKDRKSQVSIQFNWIFVIIAGAFILMFFLMIVFKNIGSSDVRVSRKVVDQLVAIFAGSEVATSTAQEIDLPKMQLNFVCDEFGSSEFNIEGSGINKQIPASIVFAPDRIEGDKMTTWSLDWSVPFRVANFLYVTSPLIRYYFIGSDEYEILEDLPRQDMMTRDELMALPGSLTDRNNYKVKFIFFQTFQGTIDSQLGIPDKDVSAISIDPARIYFYRYEGNKFVPDGPPTGIPYLSKAEIYAAIFSEDYESYVCNMKKAFKRMEQVSRVYGGRAAQLNKPGCNYRTAQDLLYQESLANPQAGAMEQLAKSCANSDNKMSQCNFMTLKEVINRLEASNRGLEYASCPLIY